MYPSSLISKVLSPPHNKNTSEITQTLLLSEFRVCRLQGRDDGDRDPGAPPRHSHPHLLQQHRGHQARGEGGAGQEGDVYFRQSRDGGVIKMIY